MKVLKYLFELIFVFLLPICFIFISFKYKTVNQYDSSGNLISVEKVLDYSDNSILRDYNDNLQYKNYLYFNQQVNIYERESILSNGVNFDILENNIVYVHGTNISNSYIYINYYINVQPNDYVFYRGWGDNTNYRLYVIYRGENNSVITESSYPNDFIYRIPNNVTKIEYRLMVNSGGTVDSYFSPLLINLTKMFGSGYDNITISELSNYIDLNANYGYIVSQELIYYSNDYVSSRYEINYTWYSKFFNNFFEELQFNHNNFAKLIIIYLVLTIVLFFFWNLIYWPLSLLFRLLLWKKTYY